MVHGYVVTVMLLAVLAVAGAVLLLTWALLRIGLQAAAQLQLVVLRLDSLIQATLGGSPGPQQPTPNGLTTVQKLLAAGWVQSPEHSMLWQHPTTAGMYFSTESALNHLQVQQEG